MGIASDRLRPSPAVYKSEIPVSEETHHIEQYREEARRIIDGRDNRKIIVVGPCSLRDVDESLRYAEQLARLREKVVKKILLIMRTYIQKPRTNTGWQGIIGQPNPNQSGWDLIEGIRYSRRLLTQLAEFGPTADEMLFTGNMLYFDDLHAWLTVGARSAPDQEHRNAASMPDYPVGLKHYTDGDLKVAQNSIIAAQSPQLVGMLDREIITTGNLHTPLVMRGIRDIEGNSYSNYDDASMQRASDLLTDPKAKISNPSTMVDTSHENAVGDDGKKNHMRQLDALRYASRALREQREAYRLCKGVMVEGHHNGGNQAIGPEMESGTSVTDPCLPWEVTERAILEFADAID